MVLQRLRGRAAVEVGGVNVQRFVCDSSEWEFAVCQDGREVVAVIFFRGERFGPEFRESSTADLQRAIARWMILYADVNKAGILQ